jgi:hypothetical protein
MIDPLFPLPEPPVFTYDLTLDSTSSSVVVDTEGGWQYVTATSFVRGYVTPPDDRTLQYAVQQAVEVDAVALVPRNTVVDDGDLLTVPTTVPYRGLPGRYRVNVVRPNASHIRLLLRRVEGVDEPHYP